MAIDWAQLKADDFDGHPTQGAFNVDPAVAANEWNGAEGFEAWLVDGLADQGALLQYVLLERFRTSNIYGRVQMLALLQPQLFGNGGNTGIPTVPLGVAGADVTANFDQIHSGATFLRFLDVDTTFTVTLLDSRIDTVLSDLVAVGVMGSGDKTAIQGLSQGVQSYAVERGYGRLRAGDIAQARAS